MSISSFGSINDFLHDNIVYRNLIPYNKTLPSFVDYMKEKKDSDTLLPRKTELLYAETITYFLKEAHKTKNKDIKNLIYIGDTLMNDGGAFQNIIKYTNWNGFCYICDEKIDEINVFSLINSDYGSIYKSNHWNNIELFKKEILSYGVHFDASSVLLIDMDKTMVGARGRNDKVIDNVRLEAAQMLLTQYLNLDIEDSLFIEIYSTLNKPLYHHFTKDNQDYLVYISLIIRAGLFNKDEIFKSALDKNYSLDKFIIVVENLQENLSKELHDLHSEFFYYYKLGDPTPFKEFRRSEYIATSQKFIKPTSSKKQNILDSQIVITGEVYNFAIEAEKSGILVFGLSDKPDEASIPTKEQMSNGMLPLHQLSTTVIEGGK